VVVALTGYTYWAAKKGMDFHFMGPMLFTSLLVLIGFGLIQVTFPVQLWICQSSVPNVLLFSWNLVQEVFMLAVHDVSRNNEV
jgi:FtsH-binding integral membrane protein